MTRIIYSAQRRNFLENEVYQNPRYFTDINPNATEVVVIGDWPNIVEAYEKAKVSVTVESLGQRKVRRLPPPEDETEDEDDGDEGVKLPENWRKASLKNLRRYAKKFDEAVDVTTREAAIEFIEAHLEPEE